MRRWLGLALLGGCGFGILDDSPGGGANLPTLGAGPYGRLDRDFETPIDEPFVLADDAVDFSEPDCRRSPGGGYQVWLTMAHDDQPIAIARAHLPDLRTGIEPPVPVAPGRSPSAIDVDGGSILYWENGGDVLRAEWRDDGPTLSDPEVVLAGASAPSAVQVDGRVHLFYERDDRIWVADSADGVDFGAEALVLAPRAERRDAFDAGSVGDPFVLVEISDAGRAHWGLWYTAVAAGDPGDPDAGPGGDPDLRSIGYAGSFDGRGWERFDGGADPVLVAPAEAPCVVLEGGRGLMLFTEEENLRQAIAAAIHP